MDKCTIILQFLHIHTFFIIFRKSDTNKDGVITKEEVFQTMRTNFIEAKLKEFKQKEDDESVIEKMAIAEANSKVVDMKSKYRNQIMAEYNFWYDKIIQSCALLHMLYCRLYEKTNNSSIF